MIAILFYGLGIDTSNENLIMFSLYGFLGNFVFVAQGYFLGFAIPDDDDQAKVINMVL